MAYFFETSRSRKDLVIDGINSSITYQYACHDYADEGAAYLALSTALPTFRTVDTVELHSRSFRFVESEDRQSGDFLVNVAYKHASNTPEQNRPVEEDDEKLSFSFSGGSTSFTTALSQTSYNPTTGGKTARDVGNGINVKLDGTVEGIDVAIPDSGFQVTKKLDLGADDASINAWIKARIAQIHTTNDATFRSLDTEDCLFLGFSGEALQDSLFDVTFNFAVQIGDDYSASNFDTGRREFAIGAVVPGFRVIWVQYEPIQDSAVGQKTIVPEARGCYVAKVFETSDFSNLGITT